MTITETEETKETTEQNIETTGVEKLPNLGNTRLLQAIRLAQAPLSAADNPGFAAILRQLPVLSESVSLDFLGESETFHVRRGLSYDEHLKFAALAGFGNDGKLVVDDSATATVTERVASAALFVGLSKHCAAQRTGDGKTRKWIPFFDSPGDALELVQSEIAAEIVSVLFEKVCANNPRLIVLADPDAQTKSEVNANVSD